MKKLKSNIILKMLMGIILPILLVAGIIFIIMFAKENTILLVVGISFVVLGFYGTPMAWVSYAAKKADIRLLSLIYDENIYTIDGLASQLGQSAENTLAEVRNLISQGYLTGYLLKDNSYLELNTYEKQGKRAVVVKCPSCGAKTKITGTKGFCEYCGESIEVDQ